MLKYVVSANIQALEDFIIDVILVLNLASVMFLLTAALLLSLLRWRFLRTTHGRPLSRCEGSIRLY
jgi:hypothetical protein